VQTTEPFSLIGTGILGIALANQLLADGFQVNLYDRIPAKPEPLLARDATWSEKPSADCRRVIFTVFTSGQVAQVLDEVGSRPLHSQIAKSDDER
jgi:3-hydroxyisobutyrate dehydrogenase-like beta-hydroxyacid dehydrogenase